MNLTLQRVEWARITRTRGLGILLILTLLLSIGGGVASVSTVRVQAETRTAARNLASHQFQNIGSVHPHRAGHYGRIAFKPLGALSLIERGVEPFVGNIVFMESHRQNDAIFSPASQSSLATRVVGLEPGFVLHVLFPLLLAIMVARSIEETRASGRLALLMSRGVSGARVVMAPVSVIWPLSAVMAGGLILFQGLVASWLGLNVPWLALAAYTGLTLFYNFVVLTLAAGVAAAFRRPGGATPVVAAVLLLWSLVLPSVAMQAASALHPLPSRILEEEQKAEQRSQGIDGHNPRDARRAELQREVLAEYNVSTVEQLPLNFDGLVMQADEEFGFAIWDEHFKGRLATFEAQERVTQILELATPYGSLKGLARSVAGTDTWAAMTYTEQAEDFRRVFITAINHAHTYGGSRTGERDWRPPASLYAAMGAFEYRAPDLLERVERQWPRAIALGAWLGVALLVARRGARQLEQWTR